MLRIVQLDEVMRQLVGEHDPPPGGGLGAAGRGVEAAGVELEEEAGKQLQEGALLSTARPPLRQSAPKAAVAERPTPRA